MTLELSLDTLVNGTYTALDTLILLGTNLIADSLTFISGGIIEAKPTLEAEAGRNVLLITNAVLCDEFVK